MAFILDFLQSIEYDLNDFEKGYLVHLLLDKYCLETNEDFRKKGYRPSKTYTFKVPKGDVWL